jgi:hypothetical protein
MNQRLVKACLLLAIVLSAGCLPANGKQPRTTYPTQLHGVWQGDGSTCILPGNLDSDTRFEIKPDKLVGYEHWSEPTAVVQISRKPLAWKIKSRVHIDEHVIHHYEIYALSDSRLGMYALSDSELRTLTVIDESRSKTYDRCN